MTAVGIAKSAGLKSMKQLSELTGRNPRTLRYWFDNDREFYEIVVLGAVAKLRGLSA